MNSHPYIILYPKAVFKEYRRVKYFPDTSKICMPDVLMVLGREPWEYMQKCADSEVLKAVGWQLNWGQYKENSLRDYEPKCSLCGLKSPDLQRCSGCMKHRVEVVYCSVQCQRKGWASHKMVCMKHASQERISEIERVITTVTKFKVDLE